MILSILQDKNSENPKLNHPCSVPKDIHFQFAKIAGQIKIKLEMQVLWKNDATLWILLIVALLLESLDSFWAISIGKTLRIAEFFHFSLRNKITIRRIIKNQSKQSGVTLFQANIEYL